jgi:hypothetical protein
MDYNEPKTRQEKKGGKKEKDNIYNNKTIRLKEAVMEKSKKKSK